nr:hypothetical protein OA32_03335 [Oenococcus oeni X2L]
MEILKNLELILKIVSITAQNRLFLSIFKQIWILRRLKIPRLKISILFIKNRIDKFMDRFGKIKASKKDRQVKPHD